MWNVRMHGCARAIPPPPPPPTPTHHVSMFIFSHIPASIRLFSAENFFFVFFFSMWFHESQLCRGKLFFSLIFFIRPPPLLLLFSHSMRNEHRTKRIKLFLLNFFSSVWASVCVCARAGRVWDHFVPKGEQKRVCTKIKPHKFTTMRHVR